jgi:alpha,alpha-trehalose phosphorylase
LKDKIELRSEELELWGKIIDSMYFAFDEKEQVYLQDDSLLMRKPWDASKIPPEKRHLLYENYHPLFLWRQNMSKQADSILGMYLHSHLFTKEELKRNYDFYQKITLHHSSLSTCVFGILASRIGYTDEAYQYFSESARMDLDDYHDNFYAGIHAANMAGTWQAIVNGFAGLRTSDNKLELSPYIPKQWQSYTFRIAYQGSQLEVRIHKAHCEVELLNETPVEIIIFEHKNQLEKKGDVVSEKI